MKRKIMVIGMAGSALKSVTDKLESDGNEVKVVDDLDNVPEILKGKYYEETRTVLASEYKEVYSYQGELTKKQKNINYQPIRTEPKIQNNEPCPCKSGKKYKKCCKK